MNETDELERLRAEVARLEKKTERLEKEENWLAAEVLERRVTCNSCPHSRKCVSFEDCARHWR